MPYSSLATKTRPKEVTDFFQRNFREEEYEDYENYISNRTRKINSEMNFIKAVQELSLGKIPTNVQINEILKFLSLSSLVDVSSLSSEGQQCAKSLDQLTNTIRTIISEKNSDENIQAFIYQYSKLAAEKTQEAIEQLKSTASNVKNIDNPIQAISFDTPQLIRALWTLLTNHEFRSLCFDYIQVFSECFTLEPDAKESGDSNKSELNGDYSGRYQSDSGNFGESFTNSVAGPSFEFISPIKPKQKDRSQSVHRKNSTSSPTQFESQSYTSNAAKYGRPLSVSGSNIDTSRQDKIIEEDRDEYPAKKTWDTNGNANAQDKYEDQLTSHQRTELALRFQSLLERVHANKMFTSCLTTLSTFIR